MGDLSRFGPEEIEQQRKQINRILKDECGRDVLGAMLGLDFAEAPDLSGKPMVEVLIPTYKGFDPLMDAAGREMLKYSRQFCTVNVPPTPEGVGVVHWARNMLIAPLYKNRSKFTHVLLLDDDMVAERETLVRMLRHERDIVGALCTHRSDPPIPNMSRWFEDEKIYRRVFDWPKDALVGDKDDLGIGAAALLVSRKALDLVADFYVNCEYEKMLWGPAASKVEEMSAKRRKHFEETGNAMWFQFLEAENGNGEFGEDMSFSHKARLCGLRVHVDTSIQPGHVGKYTYGIKDFLPYQNKMLLAEGGLSYKFRLSDPSDDFDAAMEAVGAK